MISARCSKRVRNSANVSCRARQAARRSGSGRLLRQGCSRRVDGEMEHGGACVHPMLGEPMRAAIGGGKAVISSNVKVAAVGASLDVPLVHKDDSWSFPHFDTITGSVADAPRPNEILVVMATADGGRLQNRCGTEPIR
jgi:Amino acid synthesis